ncbi:MAG: M48 family metallopeptidase [Verrucomicrobiota bacterium]
MEPNIFSIIILAAIIGNYIINFVSDRLNLRALNAELPSEFSDVFDRQRYQKSQEYLKANTRLDTIQSTVGTVFLLVFWFAGGFYYLDRAVRGYLSPQFADNMIVVGLCYIGLLLIIKFIVSLPFRIYSTFNIEEHFGFNKTTPKTFITDIIKVAVLTLLLGAPLFAAILAFFQYAGGYAWLYCWGVTTAVMLVVQFIAPRWIMPLFNKFTPLEQGELREAIENYCAKIDFPLGGVYVIDGSRRSSKANAFFTGFGKNKRIALYDTLINNHSTDELVAILAHEIGHFKKKHIFKMITISIIHTGVLFFLLSIFLYSEELYTAFGFSPDETPIYAGFVFFGLLYTPVEMFLSLLVNAFSRRNEYEADRFALETGADTDEFVKALKKLSRDNLSNLTPHPFHVFLHYSHPPVLQRIRSLTVNYPDQDKEK